MPEVYLLLPSTLSCLIIAPHRTMFSVSIKGVHTPATPTPFPYRTIVFQLFSQAF